MTAYSTTMYPTVIDPQPTALTSAYGVATLLLGYAAALATVTDPQPTSKGSNYRLAFSTNARRTIGQLWPRGQGNRI